ncbi:tRNA glutamyl-Q(34) synthetase GluQRS [Acuticoccus sp. I52.16.1]|uniref:tRNA glutamyl-Q(34) synthetase GluQRS n=1 Tax=Acuticoccus sp. I52.16.1 TaxID=2928472 RepID=UPI001FD16221|nr:tRNA glutamyl-Q(34) synthetase GluQRS [Acuticoccus sp. I52.16.1]UOM36035.1 tRNA glutamyl-Q(34) synthetase GluQRS [Acuticoccus sp. I52.16.1]
MLRFAPTPNGPLHLGHALSVLANAHMAERLNRPLQLRMEDIDATRCRPEYEDEILADIDWLGVDWQPPLRRQSTRFPRYRAALQALDARGLVYRSFATRREIAFHARNVGLARDPDGAPRFAGDAAVIGGAEAKRRRESGAPSAWRLHMARAVQAVGRPGWIEIGPDGASRTPAAFDPAAWGDVVLARKETPTSYHLAVVVDDADDGITHVVRGADLVAATAVHRVLQALLGLPEPLYHHHGLILGADGRKLSKSNGALSLGAMRAAGWTADAIRREAVARAVPPEPLPPSP